MTREALAVTHPKAVRFDVDWQACTTDIRENRGVGFMIRKRE